MRDHAAFLLTKKDRLAAEGFLPAEVYDFYAGLYSAILRSYGELKSLDLPLSTGDATDLPLVKSDRFSVAAGARAVLDKALVDMTGVIEKYNSGLDFQSFRKLAAGEPLFMERIAMCLLSRDMDALNAVSLECRVAPEEIIFLALNWLKPYFILVNEANGGAIDYEDWQELKCPVCGYLPDMSLLRESLEGRRFLHCSLCENEWVYRRVSCAVCGNVDAATLGFFALDESPDYRVDYCDKCRSYIKARRLVKSADDSEYDLTVENLLTAHLDGLLIEKGYSRP
jgi:FdhE protein